MNCIAMSHFVLTSTCLYLLIIFILNFVLTNKYPLFIPSVEFTGARKGYVFKNDNGNLGYHKDVH